MELANMKTRVAPPVRLLGQRVLHNLVARLLPGDQRAEEEQAHALRRDRRRRLRASTLGLEKE